MKTILAITFLFLSQTAFSANSWYWGKVELIQTLRSDGSFLIYLENSTLDSTCRDKRVEFHVAHMGVERTKAALSLAVAAFMGGKEWGVVVDLPASQENCYASSTASQGAGIR